MEWGEVEIVGTSHREEVKAEELQHRGEEEVLEIQIHLRGILPVDEDNEKLNFPSYNITIPSLISKYEILEYPRASKRSFIGRSVS